MVECGVGSAAPNSSCTAIAWSVISRKKSARQYHCSPAGYSASNTLCSTGYGIGWIPSSSGVPNDRTGASTSSACSAGPV